MISLCLLKEKNTLFFLGRDNNRIMIENSIERKDASFINKLNKIQVLNMIRESEDISRADIVKRTKLSAPTVTRIVDSLISDKLVRMVGKGGSTGGRPPMLLRFDGQYNFVIGIDLGATNIRTGLVDLDGRFITEIEVPTELDGGFEHVCFQISEILNRLISRSKVDHDKILGIGLAVAGFINGESGLVEYSPVFKWKQVDLKKELAKYTDIPVFYDNVSRVTALGELLYGIGKDIKNFVCVNLGYGIGAGIIVDGQPMFGHFGHAGELGHIVIDRKSPYIGKDGIAGSLEALSSGYGIAEIAKSRLLKNKESKIMELAGGKIEDVSTKHVMEASKLSDPLAIEIFEEAMKNLVIGLDTIVKLFDPKAIVLTGGLTKNSDLLFEVIGKYISKEIVTGIKKDFQLIASSFGEDATLMGAYSLVISKVLQFEAAVN